MPLASEALRGEGATLVDENGERFMAGFGRAELEPRDVVFRAIWTHMAKGHRVFLDARQSIGSHFAKEFPAINAVCLSAGIDAATAPIPVRPAAHYHMGGIKVNAAGAEFAERFCGPAAKWRRPDCMAPTVLPAIRCWKPRSSANAWQTTSKISASPSAGSESTDPRTTENTVENDNANVRDIMSSYVGVLRDAPGHGESRSPPWRRSPCMTTRRWLPS